MQGPGEVDGAVDAAVEGAVDGEVRVVAVPMRVPFRGVLVREAVLLRGPPGWGEFAPFPEYDERESARWLAAAREAATAG